MIRKYKMWYLNDLSKMVYHSTKKKMYIQQKRKVIAKLGINQYNVSEISDYALKKFFDDRFDEVEAEYMVRMRR